MQFRKIRILLPLFFILVFISENQAQIKYQLHKSRNEQSWFVSINAGFSSYYGNLGVYNRDPILKLQKESKFAYGLFAGKSFNNIWGARVYYNSGGLKAQNNELQVVYDAKISNYGVQLVVQFNTLIGGMDYIPDFAIYGIAGVGMVNSKPILSSIENEDEPSQPIDSLNYETSVSSMTLNLGLGVSYAIFSQFDVNAEIVYHRSMTDELDLYVEGGKDQFVNIRLGFIYRFGFPGQKSTSAFGHKRRR